MFFRRNKKNESSKLDSNITIFLEDISKQNPMRFSSQQLKEITGNYTKELGRGTFGIVYEGRLKKFEMLVAVKVLHGSVNSVETQFIAKVGTMCRTNHINLVKLFGFCFDAEVKALVCEYIENGSLDYYLSGKKDPLEFEKLYEIAVGTARGIQYLHEECDKKIIHYDIKPGNVLLSRNFSPKVGDFGLAELLGREATIPSINQGKGTCGFAAPEVAFSFTRKSDVYSFGMLLLQILVSKRNIEGKRQLTPRWVMDNIINKGVASILSLCGIEDDNREKAEKMCRVALMCVRYQSETRPSIIRVLMMLEGKEEIGETVSPSNFFLPSTFESATRPSSPLLTEDSNIMMLEGKEEIGETVSPFNFFLPSTFESATRPSSPLLTEDSNISVFLESISKWNTIRFSCQELKEITGNYKKELDRGRFGIVYEGRLKKCELLVAVKVLQGSGNTVEAQFKAEVGTMCRTNHINLVRLLGFCFDAEVKALVCEYMENGSLDHYLSGKKSPLEFEKLYEIAVGTARGIRYLHEDIECDKKIIHYDIKPGNVLLGRDFSPKVGDFGLAELLDWKATVPLISQGKGTLGFSAPEVAFCFTSKSDVYSFGMLLFQILVSKRITEGKRAESQLNLRRLWDNISKGRVASILSLCGIEDENKEKAEKMCRVALMCVRYQSETRPSMSSVLRMLEGEEEIGETASPFNNQIWLPSQADQESEVSAGDYQPIESSSK